MKTHGLTVSAVPLLQAIIKATNLSAKPRVEGRGELIRVQVNWVGGEKSGTQ